MVVVGGGFGDLSYGFGAFFVGVAVVRWWGLDGGCVGCWVCSRQ